MNEYDRLPQTIRDSLRYSPTNGYASNDGRPAVATVRYPTQTSIEVWRSDGAVDKWIWDTDTPGHGRWLRV